MKTIDLNQLKPWADEERSFALMDAPGSTPLAHPPPMLGFLDQISNLSIDKVNPVVLYDNPSAVAPLKEAETMLKDASFHNVYPFVGPHSVLDASEHDSEAD